MTLASLSEAIDWARSNWHQQRAVPLRLHVRDNEGLGPFYTAAFAAALDGSSSATTVAPETVSCYHPLLNGRADIRNCPECIGMGVKEVRHERYLYPMSRALTRLHNSLGPGRQPHPYHLVVELAACQWNARSAAEMLNLNWDRAEALFLMALRRLHGFYAAGPVQTKPTWIELSDAQRAAEMAGDTAA